jgi:hypothetical protein
MAKNPLDNFDDTTLTELADILDGMYKQVRITSAAQVPQTVQDSVALGIKIGQASVANMLREHVDMRIKRALEN